MPGRCKITYNTARRKRRAYTRLAGIADISLTCMVCGTYEKLQLDHHIPRTPAQKHERIPQRHNRAVLCASCNGAKGNMYPADFIEYLGRLGAKEAIARYTAHLTHRHKE